MSLENEQAAVETTPENELANENNAELGHQEVQAGEILAEPTEELDEDQELIDEVDVPVDVLKKHARKREKKLKAELRRYEAQIREYQQFVQSALNQQQPTAQATDYYAQNYANPGYIDPSSIAEQSAVKDPGSLDQAIEVALQKRLQKEAEAAFHQKMKEKQVNFQQAYEEGRKKHADIYEAVESSTIPMNERIDKQMLDICVQYLPTDKINPADFFVRIAKDKPLIKKLNELDPISKAQEMFRIALDMYATNQTKKVSSAPKALGAVGGGKAQAPSGHDDSYEAMLARYK